MAYIYISEADGEWATDDAGEISEDEDFWTLVDRISPKLWDLPEETDVTLEAPRNYETFIQVFSPTTLIIRSKCGSHPKNPQSDMPKGCGSD